MLGKGLSSVNLIFSLNKTGNDQKCMAFEAAAKPLNMRVADGEIQNFAPDILFF